MGITERFLAYAADFETTLADDDWSRLTQYFADDAVYRVEGAAFACELTGPDAIFAGMKKSLDGFDRLFATREIETPGGLDVDGDTLSVGWTIHYHHPRFSDFVLEGRSRVEMQGDRIALLVDAYDDEKVDAETTRWTAESGIEIDASYV